MTIAAFIALTFGGFMGFTLYQSVSDKRPSGWTDYASTVAVAGGSLATVVVSISTLARGWM